MAEDTQQAQSAVNATQQTPTPSVQEQKTADVPQDGNQNMGLPDEASERTRKRVEEVLSKAETLEKELQRERAQREQIENAFKALSKPKQTEPEDEPIWDQNTGLIDGQKLTALQKETREAKKRAEQAEQSFAQYLRQQEERQAYEQYPWLNPNDKEKFDQEKYNLATGVALASMVNPERFGGKQLDLKGAGAFVAKLTSGQIEKVREEAAQQAIEQLSPKEQAALEATGTAGRREDMDQGADYDSLRAATRQPGQQGIAATIARLKALKTQAGA